MLPLEALREALAGWRKTKHPRFAAVAQWATARALAAEAPRPLVGDSGKKADAAAWLALRRRPSCNIRSRAESRASTA